MTLPLYRKKPVEIEARLWDGSTEGAEDIVNWINSSPRGGGAGALGTFETNSLDEFEEVDERGKTAIIYGPRFERKIEIVTLEGDITASVGDFVIKGVKGEFYPCKPDIFEMTYDEVERPWWAEENERLATPEELGQMSIGDPDDR
jgi:hypothetical protein